jgi:hypothetical protein
MNPEDMQMQGRTHVYFRNPLRAMCMYTSSNLDQMLRPEVRSEVHNLPRTQSHEHAHGADSKPLDTLVCALIRVSQLDLTPSQVVQLGDNLRGNLADPLELCFHGLQLLASLNGVPVLGVGADVNVQLDVAVGVLDCVGCRQDVLEAYVEGCVGVGVEGVSRLADHVARAAVIVSYCIFDLRERSSAGGLPNDYGGLCSERRQHSSLHGLNSQLLANCRMLPPSTQDPGEQLTCMFNV